MANTTPPNSPSARLKQLGFVFPFRKKGQGNAGSSIEFTDEHDFYKALEQEPSGSYSVSGKGMWHGGIHVTEAGAGQFLDLKHGLRSITEGEVVAWRLNRTYLVSEIPAQNGKPAISAPYSTGFALVRHTMEFPRGTTLKFFTLYMHLQDLAGYESDTSLPKPAYWSTEFKVTGFAMDKPHASPNGQVAPAGQQGLRVRVTKRHGTILGILPQGAQFSLSRREGDWGQIKDTHGAQMFAPTMGAYVNPDAAINGWVFLGKENGGPVVEEIMPDSSLDCVVVPTTPVHINAGDLIGHLGRYDSLSQQTSNRMVHIEVFCDDSIKSFITQGQKWIADNGAHELAWQQLGLPKDPTILRVDRSTTLYLAANQPGENPKQTGVIQVASLAELARQPGNPSTETTAASDGQKLNWWKVDSADALGNDISGWVREQSFAGGKVTREFAQKWVDFQTLEDAYDPTHTMFATPKAFVDYAIGADVPEPRALGKLSPLMASIYRALYQTGDGSKAADELCAAADNSWTALRMSRLIIKHESEWANPDKWKQLIAEIEKQTGPQAQHEAEQKRIEKLVWWDDVKVHLTDLPGSDVFHIHPIALAGNFLKAGGCDCGCNYVNQFNVTRWNGQVVHYGPLYMGHLALEHSPALRRLSDSGQMTDSEHRILVAMSANEGNIDGVQAYDSEIFTAGACQKTVNATGKGEFSTQVAEFKISNEAAYQRLFEKCGWTVETQGADSRTAKMYYQDAEVTGEVKITGDELHAKLREGCSATTFGMKIKQKPLASIVNAIISDEFQDKQAKDFVDRLRKVIALIPDGYVYSVGEYFKSDLGRAAALDQHVNRPNNVVKDVGSALKAFFLTHPSVQADPSTWGQSRITYESQIVAYYGEHRRMNDCHVRFVKLRSKLS
jgi:hypothetical protein